jgi:short-subunit dehydrogenase
MKKNIFITGASSGIGKSIAEYLTAKGHTVIGTSRKKQLADKGFELIQLDVLDQNSVDVAFQYSIEKLGTIDVLINCAGYGIYGALEDTSIEEAKEQFETNYFGTVRVTNCFLPHFRAQKKGIIINIGSMAGFIGMPFQGHYSASKFALEGYVEALRMELKPFNISACNINPGDFKTDFTSNRKVSKLISPAYKDQFNQLLKTYAKEEDNGADPISIAKLVNRLIMKDAVSVRYVVGKRSQTIGVLIKRLVSSNVFEKIMLKAWNV